MLKWKITYIYKDINGDIYTVKEVPSKKITEEKMNVILREKISLPVNKKKKERICIEIIACGYKKRKLAFTMIQKHM